MPTIHVNTDVMRQLAQAYLNWNNAASALPGPLTRLA
jgi:hypothetical protein